MKGSAIRIPQLACSFLILFLVSAGVAPLRAQLATGTITGHVTDSSGAILSGAVVKLTKPDTNLVLQARSNADGIYSFVLLQPGTYLVAAAKPGFETTQTKVTLTVAQTTEVNLALTIGNVTSTVQVEAGDAAQLETQSSSLDFLVGSREMSDLPMNGRNPYGLAALSPDVLPMTSFGAGLSTVRGALATAGNANFETNGGIAASNEILLDGVPITVCCQGQPALTPTVEDVDQFKVLSSVPPAQYGRTSGGVLNIVTKSGTNSFRGDLYEYFRNDKLDAADFFTKRSGKLPIPGRNDYRLPHRFNQFGGTAGGPIEIPGLLHGRDKAFFFFGFEGVQAVTTGYVTTTVPTALERQGIFTEAPNPLYDPTQVYPDPAKPGQYLRPLLPAANGYPAGRDIANINPIAQAYLKLFPDPTTAGIANNYSYASGTFATDRQYTGRVDYNFSSTQHSFARFTYDGNTNNVPDLFNHLTGANSNRQVLGGYIFSLDHVWALSADKLLNFQYGFARQQNTEYPGSYFNFDPNSYGFPSSFAAEQQVKGLPVMAISGFASISTAGDILYDHYAHTLGVNAILQEGRHTLTTGVDTRMILENEGILSDPVGIFSFGPSFDNGPNPNGAVPANQSPFNAFASFLQGYPSSGSIERQATIALTQWYAALYLQDDWKLSQKLTLNLGVRYNLETGFDDRHNRWADFDPTGATPLATQTGLPLVGSAQFLGVNGNPGRTWQTSYHNLAPRVGFSYNPRSATVFRGGYGILYLPTTQNFHGAGTLGFQQITPYLATIDGFTPAGSVSNPFPNGVALPQGSAAGPAVGAGTTINALVYKNPVAYEQQWNFGVEQSLRRNITLNVNYAGSHGVRLPVYAMPNDLQPQYFGAVGDQTQVAYLQALVPNPFHGVVTSGALASPNIQRIQLLAAYPQYYSSAYSSVQGSSVKEDSLNEAGETYNALHAAVVARNDNGLTLSAAYTWSKLLGDVSDLVGGILDPQRIPPYQDSYLTHQYEHSVLVTDVPNRFTSAVLYALPFGRGQHFANRISPWLDEVIGKWQVNAIVGVQSGFPLSLTETGQQKYSGTRPSFVAGVEPLTSGDIHHRLGGGAGVGQTQGYFNPQAFRLTQSFEMGDVPRGAANLRSPLGFQDDFSAVKDFPIKEDTSLQFRIEAFNALNKVQFNLPGTQFGSPTFGVISSAANLPRNVQLALKLFW